ncbi:YdcF family protein [Metapseudomonas otitidis]|uniref:YdcF family protein n=1 Tax=Metapseudomonas otitidis TaxID=319939 RepID=UPI0008EED664|nr:YdcF family protein [Pseudomonas otitidis]SFA66465.1 Uncharacterized SAM-binding protein YcdF, DUF218 family [Pseudomonas otitidis]
MPIRYLFKQLLMPPGILLVLLLLAWWWRARRPRLALACFLMGFGGLWTMSLPVTVETLAGWLETEPPLQEARWAELPGRAQAIVVLGAGRVRDDPAWDGDQPSLLAMERMRYAARIAKATQLPVLVTGGFHYGQPPSEAAIMAESFERDLGVPVRWLEEASRTTWENAVESARILKAEGVERVVLVTQGFHMQRARWCFEQAGLEVVTAPSSFLSSPNSRPFGGWLPETVAVWHSGMLLNEALGLLAYPLAYRPGAVASE